MTSTFLIGNTEFGIQQEQVKVQLLAYLNGQISLSCIISGNEDTLKVLAEPENSEWFYAIYPPCVFLTEVQITSEFVKNGGELLLQRDLETEFGLYFHEYCETGSFTVIVRPQVSIEISGAVNIYGKDYSLKIHCDDINWDIRSGVIKAEPPKYKAEPPIYPAWKSAIDWLLEHRYMILAGLIGLALAVLKERIYGL